MRLSRVFADGYTAHHRGVVLVAFSAADRWRRRAAHRGGEASGRTSVTIKIESWVRRPFGDEPIKVTEGVFTYVRVGPDGKPQPISTEPVS